jgi:hypothetical protein
VRASRSEQIEGAGGLSAAVRREAFLARLARMSEQERARAARFEFDRWERTAWAARYPEEVPTVNGEVEWIALGLADLD